MKKKTEEIDSGWTRTTIVIREEHLEKLKILSWWEKTSVKDLFDDMIKKYLSSRSHLSRLLEEREKDLAKKKSAPRSQQEKVES